MSNKMFALTGLVIVIACSAWADTTLTVGSVSCDVPGDIIEVTLTLDPGGVAVNGCQAYLSFDPTVLQPAPEDPPNPPNVEAGIEKVPSSPWDYLLGAEWGDPADPVGTLALGVVVLGNMDTGTSDPHLVAIIRFKALKDADTEISFSDDIGPILSTIVTKLNGDPVDRLVKVPGRIIIDSTKPVFTDGPKPDPAECTAGDTVTICATATDASSGVVEMQFTLDRVAGPWVRYPASNGQEVCHDFDTSALGDGEQEACVKVIDDCGYEWVECVAFYIDRNGPVFTDGPTPDRPDCTTGPITITWEAKDDQEGVDACGLDHFELLVDSVLEDDNATSPYRLDVEGLTDGDHEVCVKAVDKAGNETVKCVPIFVDNTPPKPFDVVVDPDTCTNAGTVEVTFATTDEMEGINGCGMDRYRLFIGGVLENDNATSPATVVVSLLPDGKYPVHVEAVDIAGNVRSGKPATIYIDRTAPVFTTSPTPDPAVCTNADSIEICWAATDNGDIDAIPTCGLLRYDLRVDSQPWRVDVSSCYTIDVSGLADGEHTVYVKAMDTAGNETIESTPIYLDKTDPQDFTPTANPAVCTAGDVVEICFATTDNGDTDAIPTCGLLRYDLKLDDEVWRENVTSCYNLDVSKLEGEHTVLVRAVDTAGNEKIGGPPLPIYLDKTPPVFTDGPTANPADWTNADTVEICWEATDNGDTPLPGIDTCGLLRYDLKVDDEAWRENVTSCYNLDVSSLPDGEHTVYVKAIDTAGNETVESTPIYLDKTPPCPGTITNAYVCTKEDTLEVCVDLCDATSGVERVVVDAGCGPVEFQAGSGCYTVDISCLADGDHTVTATQIDKAGNVGNPESYTFTVDTTPPDSFDPLADPPDCTADDVIVITFGTTDSGCGVDHYELLLDGDLVDENATSPYQLNVSALPDGEHTVCVKAVDIAGNETVGCVPIYIDRTAPGFTTSPNANPAACTNAATVEICWEATDNGDIDAIPTCGLLRYDLKVDDEAWRENVTSCYTLDVSAYADGEHTVLVKAVDTAGNETIDSTPIYLDKTDPQDFTPTANPAVCTAGDVVEICFATTDNGDIDAIPTCGLLRYDLKVDDEAWREDVTSCHNLDVSGYLDGEHTVLVKAVDTAGNEKIGEPLPIYLDKTPPVFTTLPTPDPDVCTNADSIEICWEATDNGDTDAIPTCGLLRYDLKVDDENWREDVTSCYLLDVSGYADGEHTVYVNAIDTAGNETIESTPIYLDKTPPEPFKIDVVPDHCTTYGILVWFDTTDAQEGVGNCGIDRYEVTIDDVPYVDVDRADLIFIPTEWLPDGSHKICVKAVDTAGNTRKDCDWFDVDNTPPAAFGPPDVYLDAAVSDILPPGECVKENAVWLTFGTTDEPAYCGGITYDVYVGGVLAIAGATSPVELDILAFADGDHAIVIKATDVADNSTDSAARTLNVDRTPPVLRDLVLMDNELPVIKNLTTSTDNCTSADNIEVTWSSIDPPPGCGVDHCDIYVDGALREANVTSPYTLPIDGDDEGEHTVTIKCYDLSRIGGNMSEISDDFTIDRTKPTVSDLVVEPSGCTNANLLKVTWKVSDVGCGVDYSCMNVNAKDPPDPGCPVTSPLDVDVSGEPDGDATICVKAVDLAGNESDEECVIVTLDRTNPVISIDAITQVDDPDYWNPVGKQGDRDLLARDNALVGEVVIRVCASDATCGLCEIPTVTVTPQGGPEVHITGTVVPDSDSCWIYTYRVDPCTPNGTATVKARVVDCAGNEGSVQETININKTRVTGDIQLKDLAPGSGGCSRQATFVADGERWTGMLFFGQSQHTIPYRLEDVPDTPPRSLSVKADLYMRSCVDLLFDGCSVVTDPPVDGLQGIGNFTGDNALRGGDCAPLNPDGSVGDNCINVQDYSRAAFFRIDINCDGGWGWLDWLIIDTNFFTCGEAEDCK